MSIPLSTSELVGTVCVIAPPEMEQDSADAEDFKISDLIFSNSLNFIFEKPSASLSVNNKLLRG